jgi:hypothetical protein
MAGLRLQPSDSGRGKRPTHGHPVEGPSRAHPRRPANKGQRYPAEILTAAEVRGLIRACSNRDLRGRGLQLGPPSDAASSGMNACVRCAVLGWANALKAGAPPRLRAECACPRAKTKTCRTRDFPQAARGGRAVRAALAATGAGTAVQGLKRSLRRVPNHGNACTFDGRNARHAGCSIR